MKIKRMVKRLFAVGTGAVMLGATAMGALALDLSDYPDPFVTDGSYNGVFVVGESAKGPDTLGALDIATGIKTRSVSTASTTTVEGDAWLVGTSTKKLEMSNTNSTPSGEQVYDIEQWISKDELEALADGSYSTNAGSYAFSQYLYFDNTNTETNEIVVYVEGEVNGDDVTADFFYVKSGFNIGEYKLEFSSSPESTIQDTTGSLASTGTVLDDFENTKVTMLGKEYTIVLARRPQATPEDSIKLTLMGGATSGSLEEGESGEFTVGDTAYTVELVYTDATYAKFSVNGENTDKLQVGDTYKLADGNEIGVSELLYQSYAGGVHSADFFVGASKVELRDNDVTDTATSNEMVVGSETIDGADVIITGTDDNTSFRLNTIQVNMTAQDDYYVPANGKLSEAITGQGDEKELLFTNNWDFEYKGLAEVATHEMKLSSSTDRKYNLQYYDGDGKEVNMPLYYAVDSTNISLHEDSDSKEVILNEAQNISKNDYFVITQGTSTSGTGKSYTLQYKGADKSSATSPKIKFKNLGSKETLEYAVGTATDGSSTATIKLGGYSWNVYNKSGKGTSDFTIGVDLSGATFNPEAGATASMEVDIIDYYGATLDFGGLASVNNGGSQVLQPLLTNATSYEINITTENTNDYDTERPPRITITADATTTNEVTISSFSVGTTGGTATDLSITPEGEENIGYGYTTMGAKWTYSTPSNSPNTFVYEYPESQRLPQLYVTSGATTSTSTSSGDLVAVTVVDASKLDSEIADVTAQNIIAVGGPCVNTVAAELLGSGDDCTEGFNPGEARIKWFNHANGNVAMLVAGYSGADTRVGAKVVTHRWTELAGTENVVKGEQYSTATISAAASE